MYNADGSRGEMCGNGIRCVARLAYERGVARSAIRWSSRPTAGSRPSSSRFDGGRVVGATVDMGEPILEGREIPVAADGRVIDYPLEVGGRRETDHRGLDGQSALRGLRKRRRNLHAGRIGTSRGSGASSSIIRSFRAASTPNSSCRSARDASEDARVGARLGRDARLRHGRLRRAGRGGADRTRRAQGDSRVARRQP